MKEMIRKEQSRFMKKKKTFKNKALEKNTTTDEDQSKFFLRNRITGFFF